MNILMLGGGQLARMLALSAYPLGINVTAVDPGETACARDVTTLIVKDYNTIDDLASFLAPFDAVTIETENIPLALATKITESKPFYPSLKALEITQDRIFEKTFANDNGIPTTTFFEINTQADVDAISDKVNYPAILKTRRFGYDGKGQVVIKSKDEFASRWADINNAPAILEEFVNFTDEVSIIAARNTKGDTVFYPLAKNTHENSILSTSEAPFADNALQRQAESYAETMLQQLDYVGVLAIEFFYDGTALLLNEMAPRVHNSGHWTIEGAETSQFENHIRAIAGLPLGSAAAKGHSVLFNCISTMPPLAETLAIPYTHYHDYHKEPRANRKLGHITLNGPDAGSLEESREQLGKLIA